MSTLLTLCLTGIISMLSDLVGLRKIVFPLVLVGLATAVVFCIVDWNKNYFWFDMVHMDNYALAFTAVMCTATILWLMMSEDYFSQLPNATDRYALAVFVLVGGMVMVCFSNLVMLFLGIEILSVALYVLAGSDKSNIASNESAFKYFLMGAFASGFLLFGIALIYGYTGTFSIENIGRPDFSPIPISSVRDAVLNQDSPIITVGIIMILIGLGFKISAAPFHFWAPDVYTGAPTPITALMSTVVKTAAIGAFFRLMYVGLAVKADTFTDILAAMAVLTLLIGNVVAAAQSDVKRMLAFSSISHAGYMLISILSLNMTSDNGLLFYTLAYSIATIVAFMVLYIVGKEKGTTLVSDFRGLGKSQPFLAVAMVVAMLSMAGIPPLAGFMAKYYIFANALTQGYLWLVLFAIVMSLVGVYYYFKVIIAMFFEPDTEGGRFEINPLQSILLILGCLLLLVLGVLPNLVYNLL